MNQSLCTGKPQALLPGSSYEPRRYKWWCRRWVLCDRRSAGTLRVGFAGCLDLLGLASRLAAQWMLSFYSCSESCLLLLLLHWGGFVTGPWEVERGNADVPYLATENVPNYLTLTYSLLSFSSSTSYGRCFDPFLRSRTLSLTHMHREMQPRGFVGIPILYLEIYYIGTRSHRLASPWPNVTRF